MGVRLVCTSANACVIRWEGLGKSESYREHQTANLKRVRRKKKGTICQEKCTT